MFLMAGPGDLSRMMVHLRETVIMMHWPWLQAPSELNKLTHMQLKQCYARTAHTRAAFRKAPRVTYIFCCLCCLLHIRRVLGSYVFLYVRPQHADRLCCCWCSLIGTRQRTVRLKSSWGLFFTLVHFN